MQNLKKRNKITKRLQILVLALGFVCCVSVAFYYLSPRKHNVDMQMHYGSQVKITTTTPIYKREHNAYKKLGTIEKGRELALADKSKQDMKQQYFQLKNADYYVLADHVMPATDNTTKRKVPYLPFNETLITKASYRMLDKNHKEIASIQECDKYSIYVKDTQQYGILIQNHLVYIAKQDVASIKQEVHTKEEKATSIPVFMYHYFYAKANGEHAKNGNYLEVHDFEDQLKYLKEHHYVTLYMDEVENFLDGKVVLPKHSVVITIDDGTKSIYKYAYPLLKKYDYQAVLFLIGNKFKNDTLPNEFKEMKAGGMELESHSYAMHTGGCDGGHGGALRCVAHDKGVADTKKSFSIIGGGNVYCYPYGDVTDSALKIMKDAGVHMAFTTNYGKIKPGMDKLQLPRVRIFGDAGLAQFIYSIGN